MIVPCWSSQGGAYLLTKFFADFMDYVEGDNIQEMKIHTKGDMEPVLSSFEGRAKLFQSMALNGAAVPCIALSLVPGAFVKANGLQNWEWDRVLPH